MPTKRECGYSDCPVEAAVALIGGKWKTMILALLLGGTWRFNDLQRRLKGVSHRVLSAGLRDLEACGLVQRRVFAEVPPRVEYSLTETGRTLQPLLEELTRWGTEYALKLRESTPANPPARKLL